MPGVPIRIDAIDPPKVPALYKLIRKGIPIIGGREKVAGASNAIAMVTDNPGIAPTNNPTIVPSRIARIVRGVKARAAAAKN